MYLCCRFLTKSLCSDSIYITSYEIATNLATSPGPHLSFFHLQEKTKRGLGI